MLDSFENRLTDLIADRIGALAAVETVTRPRMNAGVHAPDQSQVAVVVQLLTAEADGVLGDDALERLGQRGSYQLRQVLHLHGEAAVDLSIEPGNQGAAVESRRPILVGVLDRLLLALHRDDVRNGTAFQTDADLGFALDGFRLARVIPAPDDPENFGRLRIIYTYTGRFWPVEEPAAGEGIRALPTRIAILPVALPEGASVTAGGDDLHVPIQADLRALGGAQIVLTARMQGAAPPGQLIGNSAAAVPAGWTGFDPTTAGEFDLVYRPPAALDAQTPVLIELRLSSADHPTTALGAMMIEVMP